MYRWLTPATFIRTAAPLSFRAHLPWPHLPRVLWKIKDCVFLLIEKLLARLITSRIVVVSEQQRKEINENFGVGRTEQFKVIPLGSRARQLRRTRKAQAGFSQRTWCARTLKFRAGIVGRLTEIKNHELFCKRSRNSKLPVGIGHSPVKFVVIGDGNLRQKLAATAASLGLADDVIFAGSRKDPENFCAGLDAVALTSKMKVRR